MTNKKLIRKCSKRSCFRCNYWDECYKFRMKYSKLVPADVGAKFIGMLLETSDGKVFKFDKEFLKREVGE